MTEVTHDVEVMSHRSTPRRWPRCLVAVVTTTGLLAVPAAVGAAVDPGGRAVRLAPDAGSPVSAAEVSLRPGTERLRTTTYSMVGATWQGSEPRISIRTDPGAPWQRLPPLADGPSVGAGEGVAGLGASDLVWTGPQRDLEVRVAGTAARELTLVLIDPGELPAEPLTTRRETSVRAEDPVRAPRPQLRTRQDWGADPSWRNGRPHYLDQLRQVHLHHTATGNDYTRADVPGIIRGMYRYHTQSLGWFDLGYNFVVDRFGRTWIGRSGGASRLVQGAHTLGFNHISVGVAVLGSYERRRPSRAVLGAVSRLAAWKFDKHGRDARRQVWVTSTGSDRYAEGERVRLPAFDGHRDTNDTACPGQRLYDKLPGLRRRTQARIDRFT